MTTAETAGRLIGVAPGILDKERIDRGRWLQSLAGAAGRALHSSVHRHGLRLQRVLAAAVACDRTDSAEGVSRHYACPGTVHDDLRLESREHGLDVHAVLRRARRLAAALWGGWLERAGPRKAGVVAALCWGGGLMLGAIGD